MWMTDRFTPVLVLPGSSLDPYSPSSSVGWQWKDLGLSWTIAAYRFPRPSLRCRSFASSCLCVADRHLQPAHWLSDEVIVHVNVLGLSGKSRFLSQVSASHIVVVKENWFILGTPRSFKILFNQTTSQHPCIQPLCSIVRLLAAFCCSSIWHYYRGRRRIQRLIFFLSCSWPNKHQCICHGHIERGVRRCTKARILDWCVNDWHWIPWEGSRMLQVVIHLRGLYMWFHA